MTVRKQLLQLFGAQDYVPLRRMELMAVLKFDDEAIKEAHQVIDQMLANGEIVQVKKERLCIPKDVELISGKIRFRASGSALLIPDADPNADAFTIRAEDTGVALHGDTVLARRKMQGRRRMNKGAPKKKPQSDSNKNTLLQVVRVLKRARDTITGTLETGQHASYVKPDDPRIVQNILVPDPRTSALDPKPKVDDKVVVRLMEWTEKHLNPEGEIIEVLGKTFDPDAEFKSILYKYGLDENFPRVVEKQVASIPSSVREKDIGNRLDCRDVFTFTIDPDDAKDFDDALSIEAIDKDKFRIGIHIADVSAYVKPDTALDKEAQKRGNSTYLVGKVIPMLPHALSNGLCSLVEAEDRLTKTCFVTYNARAEVIDVAFANTVIRSNKRLTYRQAFAFMTLEDFDQIRETPLPPKHQTGSTGRGLDTLDDGEMKQLQTDIKQLWSLAKILRQKRFKKGSLDLEMTEVKIYVDEDGYADRIEKQEHDESHQLIEEFMLAANEQVARVMKKQNFPSIYRVHDEPEDDKLKELRETMMAFGVSCRNLSNPKEMTALLRKLKDHPQGYTLKVHVLRSLKQAQYRASADGHYGLAKPDYTHFTSPIRRYADLIVHRVVDAYLCKIGAPSAQKQPDVRYTVSKLTSLGDHISVTERNSIDAERESIKTKLLEYYEREAAKDSGKKHKAIITDVKSHGLYVELVDSLAFGMIHISALDDDFYYQNEDGSALVGRKRKKTYALGQHIMVEVARVDRARRQMDFSIASSDPRDLDKKAAKPFKHRKSNQKSVSTIRKADGSKVLTKRPKKRVRKPKK